MQKREEAEMSNGACSHDSAFLNPSPCSSTSPLSADAEPKANQLILPLSQGRSVTQTNAPMFE